MVVVIQETAEIRNEIMKRKGKVNEGWVFNLLEFRISDWSEQTTTSEQERQTLCEVK